MESCDTFVVMNDLTASGDVIFGKNSDRPLGEVQEVVRIPGKVHPKNSKLQCTYIEISQVDKTHEVVLSKSITLCKSIAIIENAKGQKGSKIKRKNQCDQI